MMSGSAPRGAAAAIRAELTESLPVALPKWLETRRWFADKDRGIRVVEIEDMHVESVGEDWLALAIARVEFVESEAARYFLPIVWSRTAAATEAINANTVGATSGVVIDATEAPWFASWLIEAFAGGGFVPQGAWTFAASIERIEAARGRPGTLMRAEQSNTSLRYGDELIVKLVRRLQPGPNPDEEVLRALAHAGFAGVPPFAGSAAWTSSSGVGYPIALAQAFVPNGGDGWAWMLARLGGVVAGSVAVRLDEGSPEWLLGRRTGELHVALCQLTTPAFRPLEADEETINADIRRTRASVHEIAKLLRQTEGRLPERVRSRLPAIVDGLAGNVRLTEGYRAEVKTHRIRVHGDFHLGQTLRTPAGDWVLIDFEGEPARPVAERREKTSALKDVAGMLRSFAYARGAAERALDPTSSPGDRDRLAQWESAARDAVLDGYREAIAAAPVPLAPENDVEFREALAAWELDKALYEIAYEIRNRPDWIELPLRDLLPDIGD